MSTPAANHGDIQTRLQVLENKPPVLSTKDRRWIVPASNVSIDEFSDEVLDPAWVRVDATGSTARRTWTEAGDCLSLKQEGGDPASQLAGLMRPIGTSMAVGDAFITCMALFGPWATNYTMGGFILADGTTFGAGQQVITLNYLGSGGNTTSDVRTSSGYTAGAGSAGLNYHFAPRHFVRVVMTAANTWRCDVSPDGVSWVTGTALARTLTPTHVGFLSSSWGSSVKGVVSYEFLRRRSGVT